MPYMISSHSSYHSVKHVRAETNTKGVLKLVLRGDEEASDLQYNTAEVTVFMDDHALVERLVAAINGVSQKTEGAK